MSGGQLWANKEWTNYDDKHAPMPHRPWAQVVQSTDETRDSEAVARYHGQIDRARWQAIELATVNDGKDPKTGKIDQTRNYEIPTPEPLQKRRFAREVSDAERGGTFPLGASEGKETNWVYVEWQANPQGIVHGRPILERRVRELRRKAKRQLAKIKSRKSR